MKNNKSTKFITEAALIATLYVVLTYLANMMGLASGVVQVRLSEVLTILPYFTWAAVPGLSVGCIIANILTGCAIWDVIMGSLATLIGAIGTRYLGKKNKWLAPIPPILANSIIVPFVLQYAYGIKDAYWFLFATVGIGEIIACGFLGMYFLNKLSKRDIDW